MEKIEQSKSVRREGGVTDKMNPEVVSVPDPGESLKDHEWC